MKHAKKQRASFSMKYALAGLGLIAGFAMLQPTEIQAAVSGGAKIFNEATVTYSTPTIPSTTAKGSATVTVLTLANNPFITVNQTAQTTGENSTVTYTYNIINQSNGTNTLTVTSPLTSVDNLVNAPANNSLGTNLPADYVFPNLWGGISLAIPSNNTVTVPAGTLAGLANGTTVAVKNGLAVYYYTVAGTTPGTLASSGVAEVPAELTLTPVAYAGVPATNLTAAIAGGSAGIIIGQYASVLHTLTTTTTTTAADGTHTINIEAIANDGTATASYTTEPADLNQTITTVVKIPLAVVKTAAPLTAKPGETVTYTVLVTNNTSAATTSATLADPLSAYITYTANTTTLNGGAVADNGAAPIFPLSGAGISINSPGEGAGAIAPGATATIVYQVTVN